MSAWHKTIRLLILVVLASVAARSTSRTLQQSSSHPGGDMQAIETLRSTFAGSDSSGGVGPAGVWSSPSSTLVILERERPAESAMAWWLGVLDKGAHRGVLRLSAPAVPPTGASQFEAVFRAESSPATVVPVGVTVFPDGRRLRVAWADTARTAEVFERLRHANVPALTSTAIIGHRALSFGDHKLENTLASIEAAWDFGCSGIEIDVSIPRTKGRPPRPLVDELRVVHPPEIRSELTGDDAVDAAASAQAPSLEAALEAFGRTPLGSIYLDLKLRWLHKRHPEAIDALLARVERLALDHLAAHGGQRIIIGAELSGPGQTADRLRARSGSPTWAGGRLVWALEVTRGTDPERAADLLGAAAGAPGVLSISLLRLRDGSGGVLGWFVRDVPASWEARVRNTAQARILWTATNPAQVRGALRALPRLGRGGEGRPVGLIARYPHRVVAQLASEPDK
jgi:hypothetical protein